MTKDKFKGDSKGGSERFDRTELGSCFGAENYRGWREKEIQGEREIDRERERERDRQTELHTHTDRGRLFYCFLCF